MSIKETEAKTLLRKHKKIDSWFISRYGMNLYRGCLHNCVYCDGRSEKYFVEGEFGKDITVKINAVDILRRELDPGRKRTPFKRSFILLGGGVCDTYQPVENKYQLSRKTLQLISEKNFPVHVLTKSTLVKRDLDILKEINKKNRVIVSYSFSSVDEKISALLEPGVPPPGERLKTLARFKHEGIPCGMFLMPVIPFITDTTELLEESVSKARDTGIDFIIFAGMTLKEGKQKEHFLDTLKKNYPELTERYQEIYPQNEWGLAASGYYDEINKRFYKIARKYNMPMRIPVPLFRAILDDNDLTVVILEHIDYYLKIAGGKSQFGYAAYNISQIKEPLSKLKSDLLKIKGVNKNIENVIIEILEKRDSTFYKNILREETNETRYRIRRSIF